jgi:glycosyltransferase involved in cell wall biosynthesis
MNSPGKLRILIVASFADSVVQFRGRLIESLVLRGHEVHVAAPGLSNSPAAVDTLVSLGAVPNDIPMRRTGMSPVADLGLLWRLGRMMHDRSIDAFIGYTAKPVIYGSLAAWLANVPRRFALITGLGYAFTDSRSGFLSTLLRFMYKVALSRCSRVFFQNRDDELFFRELGIISDNVSSVVVNGSGVDLEEFEPGPPPPAANTFLMICRLLGNKGVREYAQAAHRVRLRHPDAVFCLAGWIDDNPDSIAEAELDAWVQSGDIEYLGRLEDVRPALRECCVYVLPSYREGTPRTVLEAMAIGRPVITTDAPGCRDTVIDGENGFLVPVKSVGALVEAMQRFIDNPDLAAEMGKRSREIAEEKYDVHKVNRVMLRDMGIT